MTRYYVAGISIVGLVVVATAILMTTDAKTASAHCQVPCGIYDDAARIARLKEDATTIGKATGQIAALAGRHEAQAFNQAARWVATKEAHASHIIEVVSEYFLTQKLKPVESGSPGYDGYLKKLADHHAVMVAAMKTKQTVDSTYVAALNSAIDKLAGHYH